MSAWRQVGLNYINYSNIAAKILRRSLKPEFRTEAMKRDESHVRITPWADGRPAHEKE
ncbi:protein stunted isoform X2 [Battus philenor]|uniref:protein stunted isoform X2 n=1 Tax=Battus philenor TaxID=42288 RepID=UPI0035CE9ED6